MSIIPRPPSVADPPPHIPPEARVLLGEAALAVLARHMANADDAILHHWTALRSRDELAEILRAAGQGQAVTP